MWWLGLPLSLFVCSFSLSLHLIIDSCTDANRAVCSVSNSPACSNLFSAAPYWISGAPRNLVLAPGENGVLTCRASGTPKPSITWAMNGIPIESECNPSLKLSLLRKITLHAVSLLHNAEQWAVISLYIFYIHRLYRPLIVFSFLWDGDSLKITIPVFLILIPKYVTVRNIFTKQNIFKLQTKRK